MQINRPSGRLASALRPIELVTNVSKHAEGSCLAKFGDTHVLCTATVEDKVPGWMKGMGKGWITAEYGMLPRSTNTRMDREAAKGKQSGRTQEIQRLIGRALRAIVDVQALGERQIKIDCDVIQADGGTRTAAITGSYVALSLAVEHMLKIRALKKSPLRDSVAAISCGIYQGQPVLDLDYAEDSTADTDANFRDYRFRRHRRNPRHGGKGAVYRGAIHGAAGTGEDGLLDLAGRAGGCFRFISYAWPENSPAANSYWPPTTPVRR